MFTLLLCFINRFRYSKQYFIDFSPFVKKHLFLFVNKNQIRQVNLYAFLGPYRIVTRSKKHAVENVDKIMQDNPKLAEPFNAYFKDDRAISIIKKIYTINLEYQSYKALILKEFCSHYKDNLILYFPTENNLVIEYLTGSSANLKILRWHFALLYLIGFIRNLMCFLGLVICPFGLLLRIVKYSRITIKHNSRKVTRKVLFAHVFDDLRASENIYRRMYLFNINVFRMADCIHTCFRRQFSTDMLSYIKDKGGFVLDYQKQNICMSLIFKKLFINYYKCFFVYFSSLTFNKYISLQILRQIFAVIYKSVLIENILTWADVKLAYFESEIGLEQSIFTIIANKYNVKTMTMLHGMGAYCSTDHIRANTVVNYYLVSGRYYDRYLKPSCPHVDEFYEIGIHEIEKTNDSKSCLHYLKKDGRTVVGVLASFYYYFSFLQLRGDIFDVSDLRSAFLYNWQPFFDWASKQKNVFFVFKGKANSGQYEHPFLKEVMAKMPHDIYIQNDSIPIVDILDVSDCIICSGDSSMMFNSLAYGIPAIAYEFVGYVDSKRYSKYLVAEEPDEFLIKLDYLMSHGLPDEVYKDFCRDHNLSNSGFSLSSHRIKKLIDKFVE